MVFCLVFLCACFESNSNKKIKAENLVLNQCEYVVKTTEKYLSKNIPASSFIPSCACVSDIISQDIADDNSIEALERMEQTPFEILKQIETLIEKRQQEIQETCGNKMSSH
ncbi:MAG: hypothetical protein ACLGGV_07715 [Bacteroidia bacterium]